MIKYTCFPRTMAPPAFAKDIADVFRAHQKEIDTEVLAQGLTSDEVLASLRKDLEALGFLVEAGKRKRDKIHRPVLFGENGNAVLKYEVDAYHPEWRCGLEVEAGRAWMGNAVYRDLIQAMVMVEVDYLILAVSNSYKYKSSGRQLVSRDYDHTFSVADTLFSHNRVSLPYSLMLVGY